MKITKGKLMKLLNEMPMDFDSPDRPHKDYQDKLSSQDTPLKKVPFPASGKVNQNFQELLGSESFKEAINKYRQYNGDGSPITPKESNKLIMDTYRVLSQINNMESGHKPELENLAVELVKKQFSIPDGVLQFVVKIVDDATDIDPDNFQHDEPNEINPSEPEIDGGDDYVPTEDENVMLEKSKRRLVNATLQGASRVGQYMFHLVDNELNGILGRNDASSLYGKMMSMNDLQYWLFPDELVKQSSKMKGGKAGSESIDRNTEPPTIYANGINFPVLVHELIKGLMEFFALQPQNDENQDYYDTIKSEDTITKEDWDLRLGVAIWSRLRSLIPDELHTDEKIELQNYILNHIFNLPAKTYLVLMREVMGKTEKGRRAIEKISNDMKDLYDDIHNNKYKDDDDYENYDEDGFHIDHEDGNEDDFTPTQKTPTQKKVDFDYNQEKWRLNENKK